jgi:nicotinamide mononucleotide transporter
MGIYGWWNWLRMADGTNTIQVLSIGRITQLILFILLITGSGFLGFCLERFSNTDVPYFDATMGISGLLITWMMARKYIENWICWVIVDLANAGLFIYKSLYLTAFLYIIMAAIALYGLKTWKKELAKP